MMIPFLILNLFFAPLLSDALMAQKSVVGEEARALGIKIAENRLFAPLSDRVTRQIVRVADSVSALSPEEAKALSKTLEGCQENSGSSRCWEALEQLGFTKAELRRGRAQARRISKYLGLQKVDGTTLEAAFRQAQQSSDGFGSESRLTEWVRGDWVKRCDRDCKERLGNTLGRHKANQLLRMSHRNDDDETAAAFIAIIIVIIAILATSGEEDPVCRVDGDCPPGEYCNRAGINDCRPRLREGQLCSRNGNCLSGCCKPHVSAAFLPICRPTNRCN